MSDLKCARMLVDAATRDVEVLRVIRGSAEVSDEVFGFHVQQAAEKLLKAWIALLGEVYPLTRDVGSLLELLGGRGAAVKPYGCLEDYTPYAVEFRYAGVDPEAEPIDREGALASVEELLEGVRRELIETATRAEDAP